MATNLVGMDLSDLDAVVKAVSFDETKFPKELGYFVKRHNELFRQLVSEMNENKRHLHENLITGLKIYMLEDENKKLKKQVEDLQTQIDILKMNQAYEPNEIFLNEVGPEIDGVGISLEVATPLSTRKVEEDPK